TAVGRAIKGSFPGPDLRSGQTRQQYRSFRRSVATSFGRRGASGYAVCITSCLKTNYTFSAGRAAARAYNKTSQEPGSPDVPRPTHAARFAGIRPEILARLTARSP